MKRIHIVGVSPRTGTTLMAEAMDACFNIDYSTDHEDSLFRRAPDAAHIYLSKCPRDILIVGPSLILDPHLYVICMMRDPRDIIVSKHKKDPDHYWAGLKFWKYYTRELPKLIKQSRFILIRYEDFVRDPDQIQNKILSEIPFLKKQAPFSRFHEVATVSGSSEEALRGVRPISPASVGKWKQHKSRIAGQLKLHASISEDLIRYGYEEDESWKTTLKGIEPNLEPSHFSEHMTLKGKLSRRAGRYVEALRRALECFLGFRIPILKSG
ncbi:sulfotransferase domain-containing protein [Balneolaceae bacterium YR4-1]|uniref:Sulfotransferase domain-containing protein n=1 Tax=Halalkalibaculum roseum TaxID=2709311 RepID=A0A6M1T029_9BACT|nr:sulfotransferase [Halalkalibaculum roseum]NGP78028.1 sulfotransferase domain-containing protein [Halalkalibaculum roseum]